MKKKILIECKTIDIDILRTLKDNYIITYNPNEPDIDLIIDDYDIILKNYKPYSIPYKHYISTSSAIDLSFIIKCIDETYEKLTSMDF